MTPRNPGEPYTTVSAFIAQLACEGRAILDPDAADLALGRPHCGHALTHQRRRDHLRVDRERADAKHTVHHRHLAEFLEWREVQKALRGLVAKPQAVCRADRIDILVRNIVTE